MVSNPDRAKSGILPPSAADADLSRIPRAARSALADGSCWDNRGGVGIGIGERGYMDVDVWCLSVWG